MHDDKRVALVAQIHAEQQRMANEGVSDAAIVNLIHDRKARFDVVVKVTPNPYAGCEAAEHWRRGYFGERLIESFASPAADWWREGRAARAADDRNTVRDLNSCFRSSK